MTHGAILLNARLRSCACGWLKARDGVMAQSAAAAAAAKRNSETARRSGPGSDVSFVLIAFGSYRFVKRGASKLFYLPLTHFFVRPAHTNVTLMGDHCPHAIWSRQRRCS